MSAGHKQQPREGEAGRVDLDAAAWIERRDFGDWSEEDCIAFDTWLEAAPEHRVAYLRLDTGWQRAEIMTILRPFRPDEQMTVPQRAWPFRRIIAGLTLAIVIGAAAVTYLMMPRERVYATDLGGRKTVMLADGSRIELNTDTLLRVSEDARQRTIRLDRGEAYFQVRHDAAHPFVVETGGYRVTDLGTKFSVRTAGSMVEVALVEGRTRLESADAAHQHATELMAGDFAIAAAGAISVEKKSVRDLSYNLGWRRGLLIFHNTSLGDAAAEFNRYNTNKLVIGDLDAAKLRINGTFPVHDVGVFARVARDVFGLHVAANENGTVISR